MVSAQPLAARRGGVARFLSNRHDWPDEDAALPASFEHHLIRPKTLHHLKRMESHVRVSMAGNDLIEWPVPAIFPDLLQSTPTVTADLAEAIAEIDEVAAYAEEIEVEMPSAVAFGNAQRLLKAMYRVAPRRYSVYPMPDGYIAIDARGRKGRIAVVMCGSDGGVLCLISDDGEHRRARYSSAHNLPDAFIREALAEL